MKFTTRLGSLTHFMLSIVCGAGVTCSVTAQTLLVDFGSNTSFRGASVTNPDSKGNHWNSIATGAFASDLIDTNNNATMIDLGFDTPVGTDSFNGPAGVTSIPPTPAEIAATDVDTNALGNLGGSLAGPFDFAASAGGADNRTRFQIQQLDPTKRYNLTFFGSHKFSSDDATVYSVFTDNTYSTLVASVSLNVQQPGSPNLHNRDKVATLNNLAPQASDILYVQFVGAAGGLGYLNDFQITVVPEPAAVSLLAVGTWLLVGFRRR